MGGMGNAPLLRGRLTGHWRRGPMLTTASVWEAYWSRGRAVTMRKEKGVLEYCSNTEQ